MVVVVVLGMEVWGGATAGAGGQRETEGGESFITVDGGYALQAAGAAGKLTFLSFH